MESQKKFFSRTIILLMLLSMISGAVAGSFAAFGIALSGTDKFSSLLFGGMTGVSAPKAKEFQKTVVEEESATIASVEKISPAVVSIIVKKNISQFGNSTGPDIFPFDDFFEFDPFGYEPAPQRGGKQEVGGGTGFIVSSDGLILTNRHVIEDKEADYTVILNDGKRYEAKILAADKFLDLAIVKINAQDLPVVVLGDSDSLKIGQTVIAVGNTLSEFRNTVTKGVISGVHRRVVAGGAARGAEVIEEAIQTDAAINPGNSGGPLVNLAGQVIGVNTAISREGQLVGFAIPINAAKHVVDSVKEYGRIVRPMLGVRYVAITKETAEENQLSVDYGALILRGEKRTDLAVIPGSPADKAGLQENDIILELDGQKIDENNSLAQMIIKRKPGDAVTLKVLHKGKEKIVSVILEEIKDNANK